MKRVLIIGIGCLAAMIVSAMAHASAVLVDAKGAVTVTLPGKKATPATSGLELPKGAVVTTGAKASASILFASGAVDQVAAEKRYTVGQSSTEAKRTELGGGLGTAMRELAAAGQGPTVHGMVREAKGPKKSGLGLALGPGAGGVTPLAPRHTTVLLEKTLVFSWKGKPDWSNPIFVIDTEKGAIVKTLPIQPGEQSLSKATAALGLKKGMDYGWYLGTQGKKGPTRKMARSPFTTLSAAEEKRYSAERAKLGSLGLGADGKAILEAQLDFQYGLYATMIETVSPVWAHNKSPFVKKLMYLGYHRMGNTRAEQYR